MLTLFSTGSTALANIPHENPDTAEIEYSGIAMFRYYSETLDFVLMEAPERVEEHLDKMPYTYIQEILEEPINAFSASSKELTRLIVETAAEIPNLNNLVTQSRFTEAAGLAVNIAKTIDAASLELESLTRAVEETGTELKVFAAPERSPLRLAYLDVLEKLERISTLLDRYRQMLEISLPWFPVIEELINVEEISVEELMELLQKENIIPIPPELTELTLEIDPASAFVGDTVSFEGFLTVGGQPLPGRAVELLLNNDSTVSVTTDSRGHYRGRFTVPWWYIPEINVQALYSPQGADVRAYLASLSPVVPLQVLFYEAELRISALERSYLGLDTTVTGRFDYGSNPPAGERTITMYFGEDPVIEDEVPDIFTETISLTSELVPGRYIVTARAEAKERYAPAEGSVSLEVVRATPLLEVNLPGFGLIPGTITIDGRAYSEIGALSQATLRIEMGKSNTEVLTADDGTFEAEIKTGLDFGLIGTETVIIRVFPVEPWHAPLITESRLLIISYVNWIILLIFLGVLAVFLPRRMPWLFKAINRRKMVSGAIPDTMPAYSNATTATVTKEKENGTKGEPRKRILFWYTFAVKIVQFISKITGKPHKTLREFAGETSQKLGPAAKYFYQLTLTVERLLYSRYTPSETDAESSMNLARKIQQETEPSDSPQPATGQPIQ